MMEKKNVLVCDQALFHCQIKHETMKPSLGLFSSSISLAQHFIKGNIIRQFIIKIASVKSIENEQPAGNALDKLCLWHQEESCFLAQISSSSYVMLKCKWTGVHEYESSKIY